MQSPCSVQWAASETKGVCCPLVHSLALGHRQPISLKPWPTRRHSTRVRGAIFLALRPITEDDGRRYGQIALERDPLQPLPPCNPPTPRPPRHTPPTAGRQTSSRDSAPFPPRLLAASPSPARPPPSPLRRPRGNSSFFPSSWAWLRRLGYFHRRAARAGWWWQVVLLPGLPYPRPGALCSHPSLRRGMDGSAARRYWR